ncbi:hypothetical protein, partial [Filibacter tadaridae]|uniref:hypothetical protein n=1 Tax=Filibacter tadaridae TaxID=2483811 RepID=UPI00135AC048
AQTCRRSDQSTARALKHAAEAINPPARALKHAAEAINPPARALKHPAEAINPSNETYSDSK